MAKEALITRFDGRRCLVTVARTSPGREKNVYSEMTLLFQCNGGKIERFSRNECFSASFHAHQCAWYVVKRSEDQFELMEYISAAEREL